LVAALGWGDVDGTTEEELGEVSAAATSSTTRTQLVWPVAGWIAANTHYRNSSGICDAAGAPHWTGSADLAVPFMTTVAAARSGTVVDVGFRDRSGYYVEIHHGNDVHT
jgi:murein DD-endopeptidase MepM/ murein hydrolase activator NlpD